MNTEPIYGTFHDAKTGESVVRELTKEETDVYQAIIADTPVLPVAE